MSDEKKFLLLLDLGGVILTNGWDRYSRENAIKKFNLDKEEFDELHAAYYDYYESGKLTLEEYLAKTIFYKPRSFSLKDFQDFMFAQSQLYPDMIQFIIDFKRRHQLKVVAASNEGREIAEYRIKNFNLSSFIDSFFISCFLYCQKPTMHFYQIILDVTQVPSEKMIYIDDRKKMVEAASLLKIQGIHHTSLESTKKQLEQFLTLQNSLAT